MKIIDITREMTTAATYPGDVPVTLTGKKRYELDGYRYSAIEAGMHAGTHIDAPSHFMREGGDVCSLPLTDFVGGCRVFEVAQEELTDFLSRLVTNSKILLFKGSLTFTMLNAQQLKAHGVKTVGIEGLSVGEPGKEAGAHIALFNRGINIIEGLDLREAAAGAAYSFVGLPLKIAGAEASFIRAVLMCD